LVQIKSIVSLMNELASEQAAMDFDNCGLLVGKGSSIVKRVLLALDVTTEVINEAVNKDCQMIITHHPLIFKAEKKITDETYQGDLLLKLIGSGISLYSLHTPLDATVGGCNDVLCSVFNVANPIGIDYIASVDGVQYYCGRVGDVDTTVDALVNIAMDRLGSRDIRIINGNRDVKKLAICSGAGGSCIEHALRAGADCFITGELSYHDALRIKEAGMSAILCGHYQTEIPVINAVAEYLQDRINVLKYDVDLVITDVKTDPFD